MCCVSDAFEIFNSHQADENKPITIHGTMDKRHPQDETCAKGTATATETAANTPMIVMYMPVTRPECSEAFSFTHTGKEKLRTAIAIPTVREEIKSIGKLPMALKNIAVVSTVSATAIIRLVPPILPTKGIRNALPAKHNTDKEVRKESRNELK